RSSPRKLVIAWGAGGDVSSELEQEGNQVLLTLIHRRSPDRGTLLRAEAGWHMHLDVLVARATGNAPEPFWDGCTHGPACGGSTTSGCPPDEIHGSGSAQ